MADNERRRSERIPCDNRLTDVSIVNELTPAASQSSSQKIQAKIINVSVTGACIITDKPFELDQVIQFHDPQIDKKAKVAWTCQSKEECKAGVQFI